jgi:short-subunit dehydrogenase
MKLEECSSLITGASAGIGRQFARQLASRARTLVLVARHEQGLNELREELLQSRSDVGAEDAVLGPRSRTAATIHVRAVDLCSKPQIEELICWLEQNRIEIDFLINNAGLGDDGPFATSDPRRNDEMLAVNVVALTTLTRALLPPMVSRKRGAILNVSSSAGFLPIPGFNVYSATKAYVTSFSEALRAELRGTGVTVTTLCPGPVHTEFQEHAQRPDGKPDSAPEFVYVAVEKTVRDALAAVEDDRPLIIPGLVMKLAMLLVRITPIWILRLAWRLGVRRD